MAADDDARDELRDELRSLAGSLRTNLTSRQRSGLLGVPRGAAAPRAKVVAPVAAPPVVVVSTAAPEVAADDEATGRPTGAAGLAIVREELGDCQRCKLAPLRTKLVFGVGNPNAHLVFVGEAPGADEDAQGEPFVGKAGQLLTKMIEAMGYAREDVYICNILKCRPPGNRNPEPDEIAKCEPFLKAQLAAIRPRMIVALGKFAAQCLLRDDTPISRLRGNFRSYEGIALMPTFHPAYLLRDPSKKKEAWDDLKSVNTALRRLGFEPPRPPAG
ncbi:MAG TPA: uracil-DNA glycosylase [Polyangia bacterium]|nr:uracil-DNA glycosylase [Polyangia bacterium]